jgi:hypothetical protein
VRCLSRPLWRGCTPHPTHGTHLPAPGCMVGAVDKQQRWPLGVLQQPCGGGGGGGGGGELPATCRPACSASVQLASCCAHLCGWLVHQLQLDAVRELMLQRPAPMWASISPRPSSVWEPCCSGSLWCWSQAGSNAHSPHAPSSTCVYDASAAACRCSPGCCSHPSCNAMRRRAGCAVSATRIGVAGLDALCKMHNACCTRYACHGAPVICRGNSRNTRGLPRT